MLEKTAAGLKAEVQEITTDVDQLIEKAKQLTSLDEARAELAVALAETQRKQAMDFIHDFGADTLRNDLLNAYDRLKEAYEERTNARQALRDAKDAFAVAEANAYVEVKSKGLFEAKDPVTKRPNKEWAEQQILGAVQEIPEYRDAKKVLDVAQNRVFETDMNLDLAQSRLSVARNEARLVAAMLGVGGNNG